MAAPSRGTTTKWAQAERPTASQRRRLASGQALTVLLLGGFWLLVVAVYIALGLRVATPWIMVDELIYSELAKGIAEDGRPLLRGKDTVHLSFLYPLAIAPAWLAQSMETTYALVRAINAVLITLTVVPVYLWARRLMSSTYAVATAVLTLLMPSLLYSGMVMTENAFLPAFVLAAFLIALALERPTLLRQGLALGAIALAVSVRMQGLVLIPILLTAVALDGLLHWRGGGTKSLRAALLARFQAFRHSLIVIGILGAGYAIFKYAQGDSLSTGLGAYRVVSEADYALTEIGRWSVYHAAELCLSVGVIPVSAFLLLLLIATARGSASVAERAFLSVTAAAAIWLIPTVAAFASRFVMRIEERNMFYLAPLFLLALGLWLSRGAPRPVVAALVAAFTPVVLVFILPVQRLLETWAVFDAFGLIPLARISASLSGGQATLDWIIVAGAFGVALCFLALPGTLLRALAPPAVALFFVLSSYAVSGAIRDYSRSVKINTYESDAEWIDERIGADASAVYLYGGGADRAEESSRLWATEFWNRSVGAVYWLGAPDHTGLNGIEAVVNSTTGVITERHRSPIRSPYVVTASPGFELAGELIARGRRLSLYRTSGKVGLATTVSGIYGDGWTGPSSSYTRFSTPRGRAGRVRVVVSREAWQGADVPGNVAVRVGPAARRGLERVTAERRWVVHSGKSRIFTLPTPRPPFRVEVAVDPTFSPSSFGLQDSRQLGAQVGFTFVPNRSP